MNLLCLALVATSILTECASLDFSQPVSAADYQSIIKEGFATNYFKTRLPTADKYRTKNIQDIYDKGFRNVRLRCRPELYEDQYDTPEFAGFLTKLTEVVDECIRVGVAPIISWEHHSAEANATEADRHNYIDWWTRVAGTLKDRNYHLSYNPFTELGIDVCKKNCKESLRRNKTKYDDWTSRVIEAIRTTGGQNAERIIILGSPDKTSLGLEYIRQNATSYMDSYMMVEWHEYAAGPTANPDKPRYWSGMGSDAQKRLLVEGVERANNFTTDTGIPTYFGAWMPRDNKDGSVPEPDVINFARFFVDLLKSAQIPWSLNVIDNYYYTKGSKWLTRIQTLPHGVPTGEPLNMSRVLDNILDVMN